MAGGCLIIKPKTMNKFKIEVFETSSRIVEVEANDAAEAAQKVAELYREGGIVLDYDDFQDYEIKVL